MADGTASPTLIVVSGPPGSGKTTLAHEVARALGCPAVCRDEIKEGMAHARPGFTPGEGDELTARTLPAFFGVLRLLLEARFPGPARLLPAAAPGSGPGRGRLPLAVRLARTGRAAGRQGGRGGGAAGCPGR